ncbi:hypothetical protein H9P43_008553 [Blastocladiella emersonii ATCC 22665]|nr:hypothetical protein H9P43_008553 [Blastocladiella emersonii ATCC 22665]
MQLHLDLAIWTTAHVPRNADAFVPLYTLRTKESITDPLEGDWFEHWRSTRGAARRVTEPSALLPAATRQTLANLEAHLTSDPPLCLLWHDENTVQIPLSSGLLVRLIIHGDSNDLSAVVLDPMLANVVNPPPARDGPQAIYSTASATTTAAIRGPVRWSGAHIEPHFVVAQIAGEEKIRLYYNSTRHKIMNLEQNPRATMAARPEFVDVPYPHAELSRFQSHREHLAVIAQHSVQLYERVEREGRMLLKSTGTIQSADPLAVVHLSLGSTLITLVHSTGIGEAWVRGYSLTKGTWTELDARGPVLRLSSAITAWAASAPPASAEHDGERRHGVTSIYFGTATGELFHLCVTCETDHLSWNIVAKTPGPEAAPSHIAVHPRGVATAVVYPSGRLSVFDPPLRPMDCSLSGSLASRGRDTTTPSPIDLLPSLAFRCPRALVSWSPEPAATRHAYSRPAAAPNSALLVVFQRGPIVSVRIAAPRAALASLIAYARHLLVRGHWNHVRNLATAWPLVSPGHMADVVVLTTLLWDDTTCRRSRGTAAAAEQMQVVELLHRLAQATGEPKACSTRVTDDITALARCVLSQLAAQGNIEAAVVAAARLPGTLDTCRGIAAAAHLAFLRRCPGPYPPYLSSDPAARETDDGEAVAAMTPEDLIALYTDRVAPIADGARPAFGIDVKRLAAYLEASGQHDAARRWWQQIRNDRDASRAVARIDQVRGGLCE